VPRKAAVSNSLIRVAVVAEYGIQLWDEESDTVEVLFAADDGTGLKFSDDGKRLAFTRRDDEDRVSLWVSE
jgi:hypothetical protein